MHFILFRYFFFTGMLFVYGRILSQQLVNTVTSDEFSYKLVGKVIKYQMVFCYFLYISGLFIFLKKLPCNLFGFLQSAFYNLVISCITWGDIFFWHPVASNMPLFFFWSRYHLWLCAAPYVVTYTSDRCLYLMCLFCITIFLTWCQ